VDSKSFKKIKPKEVANTAVYKKKNKKNATPASSEEPEFNWNPDTRSFKRVRK
jgi:hypothetical protein